MSFCWPKTYDDAMKPLIYINCYVGLGVIQQSNQSEAAYLFMKIYTVVANIGNLVVIYYGLSAISECLGFNDASPMATTMYKTLFYTNSFMNAITPFLVWLRSKGLRDCLQQIPILDDKLQLIFGIGKEYRKRYIRLICQIIAIISVTFVVAICDIVYGIEVELQTNVRSVFEYFSITVCLHHPIFVMLLLDMNFCIFVSYLGKRFRNLNDSLLGMVEKPSNSCSGNKLFIVSHDAVRMRLGSKMNNMETKSLKNDKYYLLQEIRNAYLEVCKLSRKINFVFGIQNLLSTGISFVMITGLLYTIYITLTKNIYTNSSYIEIVPSTMWTAVYVFKIWMVNHCCWRVCNEAERTGEVIYEIVQPKGDNEFQNKIREFSLQILQNPVRFDACGFFTLDYTFVQGMIGSITTYLVILIQMSNVSEPSTSNSIVNVTEI